MIKMETSLKCFTFSTGQVVDELGEKLSQQMTNAVRMMAELEVVLVLVFPMLLMFNSMLKIADIEIVLWWRKC